MFHAQNGLFFERLEDGSVRITKMTNGVEVLQETLTVNAFASVVSSMSKAGEANGGYYRALDFLNSDIDSRILAMQEAVKVNDLVTADRLRNELIAHMLNEI